MASDSDKMKQLYFVGAYRTQHVSDQLYRQISNQIKLKKQFGTKLNISPQGLELDIYNAEGKITRRDKIALENVVDFINNKYNLKCTLAIVREKQQKLYTVFVFLCKSEKDAADLTQTFKATKKQLSGEGFNTNLTPKGTNWTLQQKMDKKAVHPTLNGDVGRRTVVQVPGKNVRVINTDKQNGGVTVIDTTDRHDSFSRASERTSNSEVKEELHQLADEVRGIKRLLQGSKGRALFEKHYGYRILQNPVQNRVLEERPVEYVDKNVLVRSPEPIPGNVYVKNEANANYTNGGPQIVRVGRGLTRNTRRFKSNAHFIKATSPTRLEYTSPTRVAYTSPTSVAFTSPTRMAYTKRVYDSQNPYVETAQSVQPVRVITRNARTVVVPRPRLYQSVSHGSDIVHKNIEDVYKSRSLRRLYLPPSSPNGKTVEYINSQIVNHAQQELVQLPANLAKENEQTTVHVKYTPEVRTYYESKGPESVAVKSSSSNVSSHIDTSASDNLEKVVQIENKHHDTVQRDPEYRKDNVIIVRATEEMPQRDSENLDDNVVYIESETTSPPIERETIGGDVYHVRAELAEDYEKSLTKDDHVTIIESPVSKREDTVIIEPNSREVENIEVKTTAENDEDDKDNEGLFGAYNKSPDEYDEPRDKITNEKAYKYTEDGVKVEEATGNDEKENVGLFGAYTKKPEEFDKPPETIIAETAHRYHDDDLEIVESKTELLQSTKEDGGLFGAYTKDTETFDESKSEIIQEASDQYHVKEVNILEKDAETLYEAGKQEIVEEKRVHYNEVVEQIPLEGTEFDHVSKTASVSNDIYEVDEQDVETTKDKFKHELGDVVSRMRHSYEEKSIEESQTDIANNDDEEEYKFDVDALKAFSMEPDIVIVDSDNNNKAENGSFVNKQLVSDSKEHDIEVLQKTDDNVNISYSVKSEEIQIEPEKSIITEENVRDVISKTEDTVLF